MTTAISQVELTVIEQSDVEVFVLDAPGTQIAVGPEISTATPQPLGTAAAGATGQAADAGHIHAHGNLAGSSLHALASTSAAGFMSAAQFDLLAAATDQDTASTLVKRDASGDFEANIISAALNGNAATATKLATARTINGQSFDGTADITITANPNSHVHGNISNDGRIGSTSGLPIITGTAGILQAGAFGTTAGTFAQGNDARFDGPRDPNVGSVTDASVASNANIALDKLATGALPTAITVASANIVDGTIVNAGVNASAAIAGTKIAPDFGSQNVLTTGTITGASFTVTDGSVPANGIYRPAANTLGIATNSAERVRFLSTGDIAIGGTGITDVNISLQQAIGGSPTRYVVVADGTIQSTATNAVNSFRSQLAVEDSAFTINAIEHFHARQGTFGISATVTSQTGFFAASQLVGAQNNYGFFGALAAATGRWNFYASGTAPNYFEGGVRTNGTLAFRTSPVNSNSSTTATATSIRDGIRTGTPTANIDLQLPTGTNMDAAFQQLQTNQSFLWSVINLASATHSITVTANDDHTIVGNMIVSAATTGRFLTRKTAANTFVTYRIS